MGCGASTHPTAEPSPKSPLEAEAEGFELDPLLPESLQRLYTDWLRLDDCPGGSQFAYQETSSGRRYLAWTARSKADHLKVFVKSYKPKYIEEARREWQITSQYLQPPHPNVTGMLHYAEHNGIGFASFRFHSSRDLFEHISRIYRKDGIRSGARAYCEAEMRHIIRGICEPLSWMHRRGVAHRDLKPENIMGGARRLDTDKDGNKDGALDEAGEELGREEIHIIDLGMCAQSEEVLRASEDHATSPEHLRASSETNLGSSILSTSSAGMGLTPAHVTPMSEGFMSPEQLLEAESREMQSADDWAPCLPFASDVYAVAGILSMLILGSAQGYLSTAWTAEEAWTELEPHLQRERDESGLSVEAMDLLRGVIVDEANRPTIDQLLQHKWFSISMPGDAQGGASEPGTGGWEKSLSRLELHGREVVSYQATDWRVLEAGTLEEYTVSHDTWQELYLGHKDPVPPHQLTPQQKARFTSWGRAAALGEYQLWYRKPDQWHWLLEIDAARIEALHARFNGQEAVYSCDRRYRNQAGMCRVKGFIPTHQELLDFLINKTGAQPDPEGRWGSVFAADAEWLPRKLLKEAVFAKQLTTPGLTHYTRALHPHIPGKSRAFVFQGDPLRNHRVKTPYVVPGDFLKFSSNAHRGGTLTVLPLGRESLQANYVLR